MSATATNSAAPSQDHPQDVETTASARSGASSDGQGHSSGSTGYLGFWAPELAGPRKFYLINMAKVTMMVSLIVWTGLALYWGSLYREYLESPTLHGWVINRDSNGVIGQNVTAALLDVNVNGALPHITWEVMSGSLYTDQYIDHQVAVEEGPWGVVVINTDATAKLETARANGDATYDPQSAITFVYSESRNQQAVAGVVLSSTQQALTPVLSRISATLAAQYLSTISGNTAAITALTRAPRTISGSVAMGMNNLRPYASSNIYNGAVLAATYVGLIYLTILSFNIVMAGFGLRQGIQPRLKLSSLIAMRILVPVAIYFWLSLMFTLLQAAFHLDFNGWGRGYGAGFMVFWMISWTAMCALGLMLEACFSLVGPQFIAYCLIFVIISNVSGALLPLELSPAFYQYNYAFIFYNVKSAFLIIFVNAGKHINLLKYWGIILAWAVVMALTFPIWIWRERRSAEKAARQQREKAAESDEKKEH
ncbi:unnamed protein product [Sympodiomycopsis kandeliae]